MADDLSFVFNQPGPKPGSDHRRVGTAPTRPVPHTAEPLAAEIDWTTLREAHDRTSIPISTIRKWAKRGKIRARLVRVEDRELRLVAYQDVRERARALERAITPIIEAEEETVVDLRDPAEIKVAGRPAEEQQLPVEARPIPEGSILVPQDAWDRLLGQLGNIHEAGQQLADARERAAKAETEAEFLKERVREMRKRAEDAELALQVHDASLALPEAPVLPEPVLQIGWRRFRERWLQ